MSFYNGNFILKQNTPFNFCLGSRSAGKSFFWKKYCVDNFLEHNRKFIFMRRYYTELEKIKDNLFSDIENAFNDISIAVKGDEIYINDKLAGIYVPLTSVYKYKSVNCEDYDTIVFDEFLPEDNLYLKKNINYFYEVESCFNFYQTVARGYNQPIRENVKFIFISNTVTTANPYFAYFGIDKLLWQGAKKVKRKSFTLEITNSNNKVITNSLFGDIIKDSAYGNYALSNDFKDDDTSHLFDRLPQNTTLLYNLHFENKMLGVYIDNDFNYYISDKTNTNCKNVFSIFHDGLYPYFLVSKASLNIKKSYLLNKVYFSNLRIKSLLHFITS